jgi:hypothetical protein
LSGQRGDPALADSTGGEQRRPTASWIATPDGSWAEVAFATNDAGEHVVAEGGPRRVWQIIEDAHQTWIDLGQPGWDSFGLTVEPDQQTVWFDNVDSDRSWQLADTQI